jgi:integrase
MKTIFLPLAVPYPGVPYHWVLTAFDVEQRTIHIFDSLPKSRMFLPEYKSALVRLINRCTPPGNWTFKTGKCPSQGASNDCGPLLLTNAVCVAAGKNPQYRHDEMKTTLRSTLLACLLSGSWHYAGTEGCILHRERVKHDSGPREVTQHFWVDRERPRSVRLHGALEEILQLKLRDSLPGALAPATAAKFKRTWDLLRANLTVGSDESAPSALVRMVSTLRNTRKWKASTALDLLVTFLSIIKRADQLIPEASPELVDQIRQSSLIADFFRALRKRAAAETRINLPRLSAQEFQQHLSSQQDPRIRIALMLCWAHAARPSNVHRLNTSNIAIRDNLVVITWTAAKTILTRGPYTTKSTLPAHHREELENYLRTLSPGDPLFDVHENTFLQTVKKAIGNKDLRSFRRGALTTLAQQGATAEELLTLSGHASLTSLRRYILYGAALPPTSLEETMTRESLWIC